MCQVIVKAKYRPARLNLGYAAIRLEQHLRMFVTNWIGSCDSLMIKHLSNKLIPLSCYFVVYLVAKVQIPLPAPVDRLNL